MIRKIDHITINVSDIEKTRGFYCGILGFKEKKMVDCGDHRYYLFEIPGGGILEAGVYSFDDSCDLASSTAEGKWRHVAFETEDIFELEKVLSKAGFPFVTDVAYRGEEFGFISGQTKDPDGIEIEFLQYSGNDEG